MVVRENGLLLDGVLYAVLGFVRGLLRLEVYQTAGVLSNLRQVTEYAAKHESRFVKPLIQQNEIGGKRKTAAAALQEELDKSQAATVNAEKFMGIVRKHLAFEELTPTLLREMIEKIVVHECSYDENGTRRQDIEIYYSFVGKIDLPEA